jgi:hypothetical protein
MLLYSGTWTVVSAGAGLMCRHVLRTPALLAREVSHEGVRRLHRNFWGASVAYLIFTLIALASPIATIASYGVAAVFFLFTSDFRALGKRTVD